MEGVEGGQQRLGELLDGLENLDFHIHLSAIADVLHVLKQALALIFGLLEFLE